MSDLRRLRCWDLVLLGCGKSKRADAAPARDLYTGPPWAFGPPAQPAVLVLAGAPYVDGWAARARAIGARVDDPLRGYTLGERRVFARRFVAETPAWAVGEDDERGYTRSEQLLSFVDGFELERMPSMDEAVGEPAQVGLDFWGEQGGLQHG